MSEDDDRKVTEATLEENRIVQSGAKRERGATTARRNLGRSARRRRKKWLELEETGRQMKLMENSKMPSLTPLELSSSSSLLEWPLISELRQKLEGWKTPDDDIALTAQLGQLPNNAIRVMTRVQTLQTKYNSIVLGDGAENSWLWSKDSPVVIQLYPLALREEHAKGGKKDGQPYKSRKRCRRPTSDAQYSCDPSNSVPENSSDKPVVVVAATTTTESKTDSLSSSSSSSSHLLEPFPTLYWLTHPWLKHWVSQLEVGGYGVELERRLARQGGLLERMHRAHVSYGLERSQLLANNGVVGGGIAGIKNFGAVKCLHAHLAHFLSGGKGSQDNIVGEWVWEQVISQFLSNTSIPPPLQSPHSTVLLPVSSTNPNSSPQEMEKAEEEEEV